MLAYLFIILLAILGGYAILMSRVADQLPPSQQWLRLASFIVGLLAALVVFIPSPDLFGSDSRFTVSMGQVLLAVDVAPALLFLGIPSIMVQPVLQGSRLKRFISKPQFAGLLSTAIFLVWFLPVFFEAASSNLTIWILKQVLFLVSGLILWWPVAGPLPSWRPVYPLQLVYLLIVRLPMTGLGIGFTFANQLIYISRSFALEICAPSSVSDQQMGGVIMWLVGGMIIFIAFSIIFFLWSSEHDAKETKRI